MIDKNLNWQSHIKLVESKISKNIGVLFKGSLHLIRHAYQYVSHLYIYKYVSFIGNTACASTSHNRHKKEEKKRSLCKALWKGLSDNIMQIFTFEHFWRNWAEVFNSFFKI